MWHNWRDQCGKGKTMQGINKEDESIFLRCLSLGAFAGLLLFLSDGVSFITPLIGAGISTRYFFMSAFCAGVCCGFFFTIHGALSVSTTYHYFGIKAGCMAVFGFTACLLASHLQLPAVLLIPLGVLFGFGIGMLGIGKGMQLCKLEERQFLLSILLASLVAGFIKVLLLLLPAVWLGVCIIMLLIASAFMPLTLCSSSSAAKNRNENIARSVKGMVDRDWVYFCCLLLCLLANTHPWTVAFLEETIWLAFRLSAQIGTAVGSVIVSLLLLLLLTRKRPADRLRDAIPIIPLICIALLLVTWYVIIWDSGLHLFGGHSTSIGEFAANIPVGFATILGLFILLWRIRMEVKLGFSPVFIYGIFIAFIAGFFLVFIVLQYTMVQAIMVGVDSVLRIVFLVASSIHAMKITHRNTSMATPVSSNQRIQNIGVRYGLSKREIEILALLMERRSAPYIAEVEFIAISTVKTHIKHLYLKTGAHNRKELIDIVASELSVLK
jgi:DNA-binding CsgD family transcriptional regulator